MGSSGNGLFVENEKNQLDRLFDQIEECDKDHKPTPVLLSSPSDVNKSYPSHNNMIQINSFLIKKQPKKNIKKPYDRQQKQSSPSSISSQDDLENKPKNMNKKGTHELLSEDQKRANHIASEQKRRANIRIGFEKLVDIVPTLSTGHRSEALILQKTVEYLRQLIDSKSMLKEQARNLQLILGEVPDEDSSEDEMDYTF